MKYFEMAVKGIATYFLCFLLYQIIAQDIKIVECIILAVASWVICLIILGFVNG